MRGGEGVGAGRWDCLDRYRRGGERLDASLLDLSLLDSSARSII